MIGCEQGAGGAVSGTSGRAVWRDSAAGSVKAHRVTNASEMWQSCDELRCSRVAALRVLVAVKLLFWAVVFGQRQFGRPRRGKGSSRQLVCSFPLFTAHLTVTRPRSRQLVCFLNCSRGNWLFWCREQRTEDTSGAKTGRLRGLVPQVFLFPGGSSTSVHVAPHTRV